MVSFKSYLGDGRPLSPRLSTVLNHDLSSTSLEARSPHPHRRRQFPRGAEPSYPQLQILLAEEILTSVWYRFVPDAASLYLVAQAEFAIMPHAPAEREAFVSNAKHLVEYG